LAQSKGTAWFERNVITHVPWPLEGCGRQVYPGFLQLSGFMMMNLDRHIQAHREMFHHLVRGDGDSAAKHRKFYDEYLAVMDLTAEFYLQTIDSVFVQHLLPRGLMTSRGRIVDLSAIRRPALMTVEGDHRHGSMQRGVEAVRQDSGGPQIPLRMSDRGPLRHLQRLALSPGDRSPRLKVPAHACVAGPARDPEAARNAIHFCDHRQHAKSTAHRG
jgi:hypothetical protein